MEELLGLKEYQVQESSVNKLISNFHDEKKNETEL